MSARRLKPYPAYKDSGVEWLGEIPAGWGAKPLKHLTAFSTGWTPPTGRADLYDGDHLWANIGDLGPKVLETTEKRISDSAIRESRLKIVKTGSLLFSFKLSVGAVSIAGTDMYTNEAIAAFAPSPRVDTQYLYWAAPLLIPQNAQENIYGAPLLNRERIATAILLSPPIPEQRTIAAFLDRETARIDALVDKKGRLIDLLQEQRTALISHAVTKGLDRNVRMKDSGVEWLGEIPEHWEVAPVYARYKVELGKMLDAKRVTGQSSGPYLRNVDVQWDRVNIDGLPEMDFEPRERRRYSVRPGDLLVCEGGEVGRTAIWRGELEPCFYQKALHRVRPRSESESPRLFYYMMYMVAKRGVFAGAGNQNTIDHLTAVQLRHYRFPFAPEREQRAIAAFLDRETPRIDGLVRRVSAVVDRLKEFRTALISAAVTGKIDVRGDSAETSANEGGVA
jgi:type I restriction enzyme, S subunit